MEKALVVSKKRDLEDQLQAISRTLSVSDRVRAESTENEAAREEKKEDKFQQRRPMREERDPNVYMKKATNEQEFDGFFS